MVKQLAEELSLKNELFCVLTFEEPAIWRFILICNILANEETIGAIHF